MEPTATEPSSMAIVEVREESMISPVGGDANPTRRTAHFLKPSLSSFKATTTFESPPPPNLSLEPSRSGVSFPGWRHGAVKWKSWVEKMAAIHKPTWERAGILDAVMNSVYLIRRDDDLVFALAEKWCSKTNTFVFQWGEATLTLEDMAVFGYSVLGSAVFLPVAETEDHKEIQQELSMAMKELSAGKYKKADISSWKSKFRDSESSIEHEAFLVAWLSRYVFVNTHDSVSRKAFPIAIHLARGTRIALAPAVLASIYRDLGMLKRKMMESQSSSTSEGSIVKLWSPFQLVQIWAWERFLQVQPRPNELSRGEPRLARWSVKNVEKRVEDPRMILDSAADNFIWRPYTLPVRNWDFPKFYGEERWVTLKSGSENDDDLECFARCLRPSSLVGMDTIEQYLPHRVAMQFGFDQGIPGCVGESNDETMGCSDDAIAWSGYSRALDGVSLYVPSRLFEADVTTLYHQWWKQAFVELRRGESLSLLKSNEASKILMEKKKKKKKKTGGEKLIPLKKKVSKHEDKRSSRTAAVGSSSRCLLSQKISAMSCKNAKRKNDSDDGLTDIGRLVKRVRERAKGNQAKNDGSWINTSDPSAISEVKVVRRDDDDDDDEDRMTIAELVEANYKRGNAAKIINIGEVGISSFQSSNIGGAVETVNPGAGSGDVSSGQSQSHSFSAVDNVVAALVNTDRAATTRITIKMEHFEEVMKDVIAARVTGNENQSNVSTVFESKMKGLDAEVSELEKLLSKMTAARIVGQLSGYC